MCNYLACPICNKGKMKCVVCNVRCKEEPPYFDRCPSCTKTGLEERRRREAEEERRERKKRGFSLADA